MPQGRSASTVSPRAPLLHRVSRSNRRFVTPPRFIEGQRVTDVSNRRHKSRAVLPKSRLARYPAIRFQPAGSEVSIHWTLGQSRSNRDTADAFRRGIVTWDRKKARLITNQSHRREISQPSVNHCSYIFAYIYTYSCTRTTRFGSSN